MPNEDYFYLRDGFDPNSLKKDQLRNVLLTHNVEYSDSMLKQQLVALFRENITPNLPQLRKEFLNAGSSSANIELATPPKKLTVPKTRGRTRSPQPPARELSPGRASPRRVSSRGKREQTPDLGSIPDLHLKTDKSDKPAKPAKQTKPWKKEQPDAVEDVKKEEEKPVKKEEVEKESLVEDVPAPRSPRRRRAPKRVLLDTDEHQQPAPAAEIKLSAPRSSRKRTHDESDGETSFSSVNVFQSKDSSIEPKEEEESLKSEPKKRVKSRKNAKTSTNSDLDDEMDTETETGNNASSNASPNAINADSKADNGNDTFRNETSNDTSSHLEPFPEIQSNMDVEIDEIDEIDEIAGSDGVEIEMQERIIIRPAADDAGPEEQAEIAFEEDLELQLAGTQFDRLIESAVQQQGNETDGILVFKASETNASENNGGSNSSNSSETGNNRTAASNEPNEPSSSSSSSSEAGSSPTPSNDVDTRTPRRFLPTLGQLRSFHAPIEFAEAMEPFMVPTPSPSLSRIESPERFDRINVVGVPSVLIGGSDADTSAFNGLEDIGDSGRVGDDSSADNAESNAGCKAEEDSKPVEKKKSSRKWRFGPFMQSVLTGLVRTMFKVFDMGVLVFFISAVLAVIVFIGLVSQWYVSACSKQDFCGVNGFNSANSLNTDSMRSRVTYPEWAVNTEYPFAAPVQQAARYVMDSIKPSCVPCYKHAICFPGKQFVCAPGYKQRERTWYFLSPCILDNEQQRKQDVFNARALETLRKENAANLCSDGAYVVPADDLQLYLYSQKSKLLSDADFDALWNHSLISLPEMYPDVKVFDLHLRKSCLEELRQKLTFQIFTPSNIDVRETSETEMGEVHTGEGEETSENANNVNGDARIGEIMSYALANGIGEIGNGKAGSDMLKVRVLNSTSRSYMSYACRALLLVTSFLVGFKDFVLRHKLSVLVLFTSIAVLTSVYAVLTQIRRKQQLVQTAVDEIVKALKLQREKAEKNHEFAFLRTITLKHKYANEIWPEVSKKLKTVHGLRQNQREVHGDICETWEWTL